MSDASAALGPSVISSKNLVVSNESCLAERERFGRTTHDRTTHEKPQAREIATREPGLWMPWAERPFGYGQRAIDKRPRPGKVTLIVE